MWLLEIIASVNFCKADEYGQEQQGKWKVERQIHFLKLQPQNKRHTEISPGNEMGPGMWVAGVQAVKEVYGMSCQKSMYNIIKVVADKKRKPGNHKDNKQV